MILIEDDNYAALQKNIKAPLTSKVPENSIYISGLSKPLCAGIRIAYMKIPTQFMSELEQGVFSQSLKIPSLNIEIATQLIQTGMDLQIIKEKRELSVLRNNIYQEYFPQEDCYSESYYQWLKLTDNYTGRICETELAHNGIGVFGAERFSVGGQTNHNAIRIATCSPKNTQQLRDGLDIIKRCIAQQKISASHFIV